MTLHPPTETVERLHSDEPIVGRIANLIRPSGDL